MPGQSNTIGFALVVGYVVYITVRGELPAYLCVIGFGSGCQSAPQASNSQGSGASTNSSIGVPTSLPSNLSSTVLGGNSGPVNTGITAPQFPNTLSNFGGLPVPCDPAGDVVQSDCDNWYATYNDQGSPSDNTDL